MNHLEVVYTLLMRNCLKPNFRKKEQKLMDLWCLLLYIFRKKKKRKRRRRDKEERRNPKSLLLKRYVLPGRLLVKGQSQSVCLQEAVFMNFFTILLLPSLLACILHCAAEGFFQKTKLFFRVSCCILFIVPRLLFDYRKIDVMEQVRPTTDTF